MIDFLLFLLVLVIFFVGVQVGATVGSIGAMIRWIADWVDTKFKKKP
jgi:hypothetical protein